MFIGVSQGADNENKTIMLQSDRSAGEDWLPHQHALVRVDSRRR